MFFEDFLLKVFDFLHIFCFRFQKFSLLDNLE